MIDKPNTHTPESDRHPEVAERAVRTLERLGMDELLSTPNGRRQFFRDLDDDGFRKYLGFINSVTRGKPIQYEFQDGKLPGLGTPPLEDKEVLMLELFAAARHILADTTLDDEVALEYAGLTIGGGSALTHPYKEGNGRTSRVAQYLMTYGNERGSERFEADLFGIIAKDPQYGTDTRKMMRNTVPPAVVNELQANNFEHFREEFDASSTRHQASMRFRTFARMMSGKLALNKKPNPAIS